MEVSGQLHGLDAQQLLERRLGGHQNLLLNDEDLGTSLHWQMRYQLAVAANFSVNYVCSVLAESMKATDHQKLALTSPTSGGRSVGIVRSLTKAMEFVDYRL
jgi:hypothetical protein